MKKKIVYVDMDNTIVDFKSGIEKLSKEDQEKLRELSSIRKDLNVKKDSVLTTKEVLTILKQL